MTGKAANTDAASAPTEPPARFARVEGAVLAAVALGALVFQLWLPSTHVAESDYQAVAQVLAAERAPGDVVLLAPWWTERARIFVPDGLPVVGYQGSDADPLERYPRIWVLSQPHLPRAGSSRFEEQFLPSRTPVGAERSFGNLTLRLFQNGRHRPLLLEAAELLPNASVYLEGPDGARQPCTWTGNGHRCPNGKMVVKEWRDVHWAPWPCVRMEAPGGATRIAMEFTAPVSTAASALQAGYIWEYGSCKEGCTPSTVWFEAGGQSQSMELATGDEGMHRLEGPPLQQGAPVKLALMSQNPNARVVCFVMTGWGTR